MKQKYSGAQTSINTKRIPRLFTTVTNKLNGWQPGTINVDLGCGRDPSNVNTYLEGLGVYNAPWDPHWGIVPDRRLLDVMRVNTMTISNVLNVIKEKKVRNHVLQLAAEFCSGITYITVYEGDKSGKGRVTKKDCWQANRPTKSYVKEVKRVFKEAYVTCNVIVAYGER